MDLSNSRSSPMTSSTGSRSLGTAEHSREQIAAFVETEIAAALISPLTAGPLSVGAALEAFAPALHA